MSTMSTRHDNILNLPLPYIQDQNTVVQAGPIVKRTMRLFALHMQPQLYKDILVE